MSVVNQLIKEAFVDSINKVEIVDNKTSLLLKENTKYLVFFPSGEKALIELKGYLKTIDSFIFKNIKGAETLVKLTKNNLLSENEFVIDTNVIKFLNMFEVIN